MDINSAFEKSFDLSSKLVIFPIRHHSPGCSAALKKAALLYSPDCILIEGPADADKLIPFLQSSGINPPVSIYSSYSDEKEKYRAYYPFLDYSPELTAMRTAAELNIPAFFADMPYPLTALMSKEKKIGRQWSEESDYYALAAQKSGCRCFSEFWERYFEISADKQDCREFARSVFALGAYMRELSPADEKTLCREEYMRRKISEYSEKYSRILMVCGAYHAPALLEKGKKMRFRTYSEKNSALYITPYSFAESDSRSGYGAGILFPAYYNRVYQMGLKGTEEPYLAAASEFIVKTARKVRKNTPVSVPDEREALYMAEGLAALRGKPAPGAFELIDGVRSAFLKNSSEAGSEELDTLLRLMTGMGAGEVNIPETDGIIITPPCVTDFRACCKKYRINIGTVAKQQTVLDIVKNQNHYKKSCFLHRLQMLGTDFCKLEKGPDYAADTDTSLIREHWSYNYSSMTEARLIDLSVYGDTVEKISLELLQEAFLKAVTSAQTGSLLLTCYMTGFSREIYPRLPQLAELVRSDADFLGQREFLTSVHKLLTLIKLSSGEYDEGIEKLLEISYNTALGAFHEVMGADNTNAGKAASGLRLMYSLSADFPLSCSRDALKRELSAAVSSHDTSPILYGTCLALLYKCSSVSLEEYCGFAENYLLSADGEAAAGFISGIIAVGRDVLLISEGLLKSIDAALKKTDSERFMEILPKLREAFTAFTPQETVRISKSISKLYNFDMSSLEGSFRFTASETAAAVSADRKAADIMKRWGLL